MGWYLILSIFMEQALLCSFSLRTAVESGLNVLGVSHYNKWSWGRRRNHFKNLDFIVEVYFANLNRVLFGLQWIPFVKTTEKERPRCCNWGSRVDVPVTGCLVSGRWHCWFLSSWSLNQPFLIPFASQIKVNAFAFHWM